MFSLSPYPSSTQSSSIVLEAELCPPSSIPELTGWGGSTEGPRGLMIETGVSILQHPTAGPGLHDSSIHGSVLPRTRSQPMANPLLMGQGPIVYFKHKPGHPSKRTCLTKKDGSSSISIII